MHRLTKATVQILTALLESPLSWRYGYDLMKGSGLASGTLYPLLARLEDDGWLETRWGESALPGRPPRHLYRLTASGRAEARAAVAGARHEWLAKARPQRA